MGDTKSEEVNGTDQTEQTPEEGTPAVLIRVAEWTQWMPAEMKDLGFERRKAPLASGYTATPAAPGEKMIDLHVQPTGGMRGAEVIDDETNEKVGEMVWKQLSFRAVFAISSKMEELQPMLDAQEPPPEPEERDRAEDLVIASSIPQGPNRAARRKTRPKR